MLKHFNDSQATKYYSKHQVQSSWQLVTRTQRQMTSMQVTGGAWNSVRSKPFHTTSSTVTAVIQMYLGQPVASLAFCLQLLHSRTLDRGIFTTRMPFL